MNWLDIVLIVALGLSILMGLWTGLVRMIFMLIGVIVGMVLAGAYTDGLADKCTFFNNVTTAHIFAFIVIFLGTIIVASIIGMLIRNMLKNVGLGLIDRVGGAVLGVVVSAIFFGGILAMYLQYVGPTNIITTSPVAGFLVDKFGIVLGLLPSQFDNIQYYF